MKKFDDFYEKCKQILKTQYPSTKNLYLSKLPLSPFVITLNKDVVQAIKKSVHIIYKMAHSETYLKKIQKKYSDFKDLSVPHHSLLMSYDFHVNSKGHLKLIEVNTNSSGYLMSDLAYRAHGKKTSALSLLKESFEQEWFDFSGHSTPPDFTAIMDDGIKEQKMYIEFLMYRDLLKSWSWNNELCEAKDISMNSKGDIINSLQQKIFLIYNRSTDFYLERFPKIKSAFLNHKCCISPQPIEYLLLADKERFCDWSSEDFLDQLLISSEEKQWIQNIIPFTSSVRAVSPEKLWEQRKQFFFKPLRGYGGKSVYRGKTISRKMFSQVLESSGLYQVSVPPAVFSDFEGMKWKYDIRAYVYKDQVQQLTARLYQGQLTGIQGTYSGFAAVCIK